MPPRTRSTGAERRPSAAGMAKVVYRALADASLRAGLPAFMADIAARPSACVPDGSVVVTAVNTAHSPLLHAQVVAHVAHVAHAHVHVHRCDW